MKVRLTKRISAIATAGTIRGSPVLSEYVRSGCRKPYIEWLEDRVQTAEILMDETHVVLRVMPEMRN